MHGPSPYKPQWVAHAATEEKNYNVQGAAGLFAAITANISAAATVEGMCTASLIGICTKLGASALPLDGQRG